MNFERSQARTTGKLEEIGLCNVLNRIWRGYSDVDGFLLAMLRQRGLVEPDRIALTAFGTTELARLTRQLGWSDPSI